MRLTQLTSQLSESTLRRVWQFAADPARVFAIMSACRNEYARDENLRRTADLANQIRSAGFGYFMLNGRYRETDAAGKQHDVDEPSFFLSAPASPQSDRRLTAFVLDMLGRFEQEAAVVKHSGTSTAKLLRQDGTEVDIGSLKPNAVADAYSQLRRGKRTFVFESACPALSWTGALVRLVEARTDGPASAGQPGAL